MEQTLHGAPASTLARLLNDPEEHDFASLERILVGIPPELAVVRHDGWPYSIADLLAHVNSNVQFNLELIRAADPAAYQNPYENWPKVQQSDWGKVGRRILLGNETT